MIGWGWGVHYDEQQDAWCVAANSCTVSAPERLLHGCAFKRCPALVSVDTLFCDDHYPRTLIGGER